MANSSRVTAASYDRDGVSLSSESERYKKTQKLASLLDSEVRLPGGFRVGLDGLIGIIPGVGDAVGGLLSSWILYQGHRMGLPKRALVHMGFNIAVDSIIGVIPVVGDLFDFAWKANAKNMKIIEKHQRKTRDSVVSRANTR